MIAIDLFCAFYLPIDYDVKWRHQWLVRACSEHKYIIELDIDDILKRLVGIKIYDLIKSCPLVRKIK